MTRQQFIPQGRRDKVLLTNWERLDVLKKGLYLTPLIFALAVAPAMAKPTIIAELGSAPLLGTSTSTAEMRARVARNEGIVSAAAVKIGLTPGEYAQFHAAIDSSRVAWVTVPRHLDAMTWQAGGTVYALHNVVIPAGTNGWEVDVRRRDKILALYMPAKCGNLSLVTKAAPKVLAEHVVPTRVAALKVVPPQVATAPVPVIPDDTPAVVPAVVAQSAFPPVAAAVAHHSVLFLAPLLAGLAALSGGSGSGPIVAPPAGCP
jgi:hypothetical protein